MPTKPFHQMLVASAVLILTFFAGFVTGGVQKTYDPETCNNALREESGAPATNPATNNESTP